MEVLEALEVTIFRTLLGDLVVLAEGAVAVGASLQGVVLPAQQVDLELARKATPGALGFSQAQGILGAIPLGQAGVVLGLLVPQAGLGVVMAGTGTSCRSLQS